MGIPRGEKFVEGLESKARETFDQTRVPPRPAHGGCRATAGASLGWSTRPDEDRLTGISDFGKGILDLIITSLSRKLDP